MEDGYAEALRARRANEAYRKVRVRLEELMNRLGLTVNEAKTRVCRRGDPFDAVDAHARERLRRWLRKKHKVWGRGTLRYPDEYVYRDRGSEWLKLRTCNLPRAKA